MTKRNVPLLASELLRTLQAQLATDAVLKFVGWGCSASWACRHALLLAPSLEQFVCTCQCARALCQELGRPSLSVPSFSAGAKSYDGVGCALRRSPHRRDLLVVRSVAPGEMYRYDADKRSAG